MCSSLLFLILLAAEGEESPMPEPDCLVLLLQPQASLSRLAVSITSGDRKQCDWPMPGVPLEYQLTRPAYTVRLKVFENSSGGIALVARDAVGNPVQLRGAMFMDAVEMDIPLTFGGVDYRYWVLSNWLRSEPIEFEVVGTDGLLLGRERLAYTELHSRQANP